MAKPQMKANQIHQKLLGALIETQDTSWTRTAWRTDPDTDKLEEVKVKVNRQGLRYPLAQNVSEENVEAASRRWM